MKAEGVPLADWAKIIGTALSVLSTFVGFVVWLTHVDTKVESVASAQTTAKADLVEYQKAQAQSLSEIFLQLRDSNTRLSHIEGMQAEVLREVKRGR